MCAAQGKHCLSVTHRYTLTHGPTSLETIGLWDEEITSFLRQEMAPVDHLLFVYLVVEACVSSLLWTADCLTLQV